VWALVLVEVHVTCGSTPMPAGLEEGTARSFVPYCLFPSFRKVSCFILMFVREFNYDRTSGSSPPPCPFCPLHTIYSLAYALCTLRCLAACPLTLFLARLHLSGLFRTTSLTPPPGRPHSPLLRAKTRSARQFLPAEVSPPSSSQIPTLPPRFPSTKVPSSSQFPRVRVSGSL